MGADKKKATIAKPLVGKKDSAKEPVKADKPKAPKPLEKARMIASPSGKKR